MTAHFLRWPHLLKDGPCFFFVSFIVFNLCDKSRAQDMMCAVTDVPTCYVDCQDLQPCNFCFPVMASSDFYDPYDNEFTQEKCALACYNTNEAYTYAGILDGPDGFECRCSTTDLQSKPLCYEWSGDDCSSNTCPGNEQQSCGSDGFIIVYEFTCFPSPTKFPSVAPTLLPSASPTRTPNDIIVSSTAAFDAVNIQAGDIGNYEVTVDGQNIFFIRSTEISSQTTNNRECSTTFDTELTKQVKWYIAQENLFDFTVQVIYGELPIRSFCSEQDCDEPLFGVGSPILPLVTENSFWLYPIARLVYVKPSSDGYRYNDIQAKAIVSSLSSSWLCPSFFADKSLGYAMPDSLEEISYYTPGSVYNNYYSGVSIVANNSDISKCDISGQAKESTLSNSDTIFDLASGNLIGALELHNVPQLTSPMSFSYPVLGRGGDLKSKYKCLKWKDVLNSNNYEKVYSYIRNWYRQDDEVSSVNPTLAAQFFSAASQAENTCSNFQYSSGSDTIPFFDYVSCPVMWQASTTLALMQPGENLFLYTTSENQQEYFMILPCQIPLETTQLALNREYVATPCVTCSSGTRSCDEEGLHCGERQCLPCSMGTYQNNDGETACIKCEVGTYGDEVGLSSCKLCQEGETTDVEESTVCHEENCQPGKKYDETSRICVECGTGTYQDQAQKTECKSCDLTGQKRISSSVCLCEVGYGTLNETPQGCEACSIGTYQDQEAVSECIHCGVDKSTQSIASTSQNQCLCERGYAYVLSSDSCKACAVGKYQDQLHDTNCKECEVGFYQNEESRPKCKGCIVGTYQNEKGATLCIACAVGTFARAKTFSFFSEADECKACQVGTYQNEEAEGRCKICSRGDYQSKTGKTDCQLCSRGTYQNDRAQSKCIHCAAGTYENFRGKSECKECVKGTYIGASGKTKCIACERGKFANLKGEKECKKCILGTFASDAAESECTECDFGTYENEKGKSECKICQYGKFMNVQGKTRCKRCQAGTYANERGEKNCKECQLGTYGEQSEMRQCFEAANGNYVDQTGQTAPKDSCPLGTFAPYCGLSKCVECYEGFASSDVERCAPCVTGKYQDERGQYNTGGSQTAACKTCPDDQTGFEPGQPFCLCNPGKYTIRPGKCGRCTGQEYQDDYGQAHCKTCPDFFMPLPSHVECVPVTEEITRTCLMVFWVPECYKQGIHPITIILWLVVIILFYYSTRTAARKLWEFIWT